MIKGGGDMRIWGQPAPLIKENSMAHSLNARRRIVASSVAIFASVSLLAACSSSDTAEETTSPEVVSESTDAGEADAETGDAGNDALAEATARVQLALLEPTVIGQEEPLVVAAPAGKNVTFLECGVEICNVIGNEVDDAAELLGWDVTRTPQGTTPEEILGAWDIALNASPTPDAIITSGVPSVLIQPKLDEAAAAGIPVVDYASGSPTGTAGVTVDVLPVGDNEERGFLMADWAAVETEGNAKVLFLNVPDYLVIDAGAQAFSSRLSEICPDTCSTEILDFAATDIGTKIPQDTVSYLQRNPDTNIIVYGFDDMGLGVAEAIQAAGLQDQVSAIGQGGGVATIDAIGNDRVQVATVPQGMGQLGWSSMDALARIFSNTPLDSITSRSGLPIWLQTKETLTETPWMGSRSPDYRETYSQLWLIGG